MDIGIENCFSLLFGNKRTTFSSPGQKPILTPSSWTMHCVSASSRMGRVVWIIVKHLFFLIRLLSVLEFGYYTVKNYT